MDSGLGRREYRPFLEICMPDDALRDHGSLAVDLGEGDDRLRPRALNVGRHGERQHAAIVLVLE